MKSYDKKNKMKKKELKKEVTENSDSSVLSEEKKDIIVLKEEKKIDRRKLTIKEILKKNWLIGNKKKITFSEFRKKKYIDLRNYFDCDGELKPTKKGISLSVDEFLEFAKIFDEIKSYVELF